MITSCLKKNTQLRDDLESAKDTIKTEAHAALNLTDDETRLEEFKKIDLSKMRELISLKCMDKNDFDSKECIVLLTEKFGEHAGFWKVNPKKENCAFIDSFLTFPQFNLSFLWVENKVTILYQTKIIKEEQCSEKNCFSCTN